MGTEGPSSQLLFTPISHTEPRKLGRKHIHTFLVERERYILRVKDASQLVAARRPFRSLQVSILIFSLR